MIQRQGEKERNRERWGDKVDRIVMMGRSETKHRGGVGWGGGRGVERERGSKRAKNIHKENKNNPVSPLLAAHA